MAGGRGAARAADRNPHLGGPVTGGAVRAGRDPRAAGAAPEPGGRVPEPGGRGRSRGARGPWHRTRYHRQHREGGRPMTAAALTPTPAKAARVTLPSAVALALARTRLELRQFFRERDAVIFIFAYPIIMLAIFATVFADQEIDFGPGGTLDFATYFLPGMIATGVLLSSFQNLAIGIAEERDAGGLKRLRGTPMPSSAYFLGKVGSVLTASVIQMLLLLGVATLMFGVDLPTEPGRWWTFAWVFVLGTASGAICGVAFSSLPRSARSANAVVTPVVLVLQFISVVFFMFSDLPAWMQQVAAVFPLKWMAQGMRSVFLPEAAKTIEPAGSWEHGPTAAILAAYLVLGRRAAMTGNPRLALAYLAVMFVSVCVVVSVSDTGTLLLFIAYSQVWYFASSRRAGVAHGHHDAHGDEHHGQVRQGQSEVAGHRRPSPTWCWGDGQHRERRKAECHRRVRRRWLEQERRDAQCPHGVEGQVPAAQRAGPEVRPVRAPGGVGRREVGRSADRLGHVRPRGHVLRPRGRCAGLSRHRAAATGRCGPRPRARERGMRPGWRRSGRAPTSRPARSSWRPRAGTPSACPGPSTPAGR